MLEMHCRVLNSHDGDVDTVVGLEMVTAAGVNEARKGFSNSRD
jgi:hypothetical protein